jgi:hypothetical protein
MNTILIQNNKFQLIGKTKIHSLGNSFNGQESLDGHLQNMELLEANVKRLMGEW